MPQTPWHRRNRKLLAISLACLIVLLIAAGVTATLVKRSNDKTEARNKAEAASSSSAQAEAVAAQEKALAAKRLERKLMLVQVEGSIKTMAEKHVANGLFDGPILSASCDPVGGGSTDDLTAKTTIFDCFAATTDNGDGTLSGRKYHATVNWDTGNFTYGLGAP